MPVFINEVVIRSNLQRPDETGSSAGQHSPGTAVIDREALVEEISRRVLEQIERELDRLGER